MASGVNSGEPGWNEWGEGRGRVGQDNGEWGVRGYEWLGVMVQSVRRAGGLYRGHDCPSQPLMGHVQNTVYYADSTLDTVQTCTCAHCTMRGHTPNCALLSH